MLRTTLGLLLLLLTACSTTSTAPEAPLRVLYLSQSVGFVHETVRRPPGSLSVSEIAFQQMASDNGFALDLTQDARDLTPARLADIDVLAFNTTGALPIDQATWAAVIDWIESGRGGFVGIHSATDTALDFEGGQDAYSAFIGGRFESHPWVQGTPIRLNNLEPSHPVAASWPDGVQYAEEIYQYVGLDPARVRVIQALDMSFGPVRRPYPVPVTWVRAVGRGRLFYTNLGHTPSTWDDPRFRSQLVSAILWTGGRIPGPAAPHPALP